MGWIWYSGKACLFSGNEGDMILQTISQTVGNQYVIKFDIVGRTQGKLKLDNYEEVHEFTTDGSYAVIGTAQNNTLVFSGELDEDDNLFDGCIDNIAVYEFNTLTSTACSPCINVSSDQDECLLLFNVTNTGTQLGFQWDDLELKTRIKARFAKADYESRKEAFDDNGGDFIITYFDGKKQRMLLVDAVPVYIHDFLFMCMGVDTLTINSVEYVLIDDEYPSITWNKSMTEGTVELKLRKKNYRLNKTNCG